MHIETETNIDKDMHEIEDGNHSIRENSISKFEMKYLGKYNQNWIGGILKSLARNTFIF